MAGGWWLVAGGWWLVAGGWWPIADCCLWLHRNMFRMVPASSGCPVEGLAPNGPALYHCPTIVLALYKRRILSLSGEC